MVGQRTLNFVNLGSNPSLPANCPEPSKAERPTLRPPPLGPARIRAFASAVISDT